MALYRLLCVLSIGRLSSIAVSLEPYAHEHQGSTVSTLANQNGNRGRQVGEGNNDIFCIFQLHLKLALVAKLSKFLGKFSSVFGFLENVFFLIV
jgi:hypothetical protein